MLLVKKAALVDPFLDSTLEDERFKLIQKKLGF